MASNTPSVITCRVSDAQGAPIAAARVFFTAGPGAFPEIAALTDAGGAVVLAAPTPGDYHIQAVADGFAPQTISVTVAAGEQATADIVLQAA